MPESSNNDLESIARLRNKSETLPKKRPQSGGRIWLKSEFGKGLLQLFDSAPFHPLTPFKMNNL
jgi:hypothetical protein